MSAKDFSQSVLVLTVGTGNVADLENTLFKPLLQSIGSRKWDRVVLLPSQATRKQAEEVGSRIPSMSVDVQALPRKDSEVDVDACFAHFDAVLGQLIEGVHEPARIMLDFTRGTKAMSAALVLAGVGREIPVLRYIQGDRGPTGTVVAGTEEIREVTTVVVNARKTVDMAARLMRQGNFEAAGTLLGASFTEQLEMPGAMKDQAKAYGVAAQVYAAWDRFDYKGAVERLGEYERHALDAGEFAPPPKMKDWIARLAKDLDRKSHKESAAHLKHLACDMLESARRRYRDGHHEDVAIRCYRVLELIGQLRLFACGYDSGCLPADDPKIKGFQEKLKKKDSNPLRENHRKDLKGTLNAGREQVARLLKFLGDPLAKPLMQFARSFERYVKARNEGILIHGFVAMTPGLRNELPNYMDQLERLLVKDDPGSTAKLEIARSLDFSRRV